MKKSKGIIKYSILFLFIMLPIIDCLRNTSLKDIDLFGVSIIEIINIVIIGYTLILSIINFGNNKKYIISLIMYTIILFIYMCLHNFNILNFDTSVFPDSNINLITESYYIFRVYYMPVLLLFILIKNRDIFNMEFYAKAIKILVCIISLSIIILNIFKLSYATYGDINDGFVKYNIFDFYKSSGSTKLLVTRGWFDSSNEISAVLMMLLPLNIYLLFKENKKFNMFLYIVQVISMIVLGTRVATFGAMLITLVVVFINIYSKIINKDKINMKFIIWGVLCSSYFFISPIGYHYMNYVEPVFGSDDEYSETLKTLENDDEIVSYINDNLYYFRIHNSFVELYSLEGDVEFWYDVALRDRNLNNDSRVMKTTIIDRIYDRNNNKYDKYLGMGYTMNFMDLERDYVYQFYLFGILGLILIVPQIISFIRTSFGVLKNFKSKNIMGMLILLMSPALGFVVAYYSGHVFGWVSPSYILVLGIAIVYYFVNRGSDGYAKS